MKLKNRNHFSKLRGKPLFFDNIKKYDKIELGCENMKEPIFYRIVRPIITFLFKIVYRPTIEGRENIPKKGRVVLAGNHTNNLDCLLLISSTPRTIHFMAKDSLMKGIKKFIFKGMGIIPVDRTKKDSASLMKAIDFLNHEKLVGIFPEGTINRTDDITLPFKFGAVKMSKETDAKVVPFIITGPYRPFKKGLHIQFLDSYKLEKELEIENANLQDKISTVLKKYKEEL